MSESENNQDLAAVARKCPLQLCDVLREIRFLEDSRFNPEVG
jgi:hypothetical protein